MTIAVEKFPNLPLPYDNRISIGFDAAPPSVNANLPNTMNHCILLVEVMQPPQIRYTSENVPVADAIVQFESTRENEPPASLKMVAWNRLATEVEQQGYQVGDRLLVEGRISMVTIDRPEGFREKHAELRAQRIHPLSALAGGMAGGMAAGMTGGAGVAAPPAPNYAPPTANYPPSAPSAPPNNVAQFPAPNAAPNPPSIPSAPPVPPAPAPSYAPPAPPASSPDFDDDDIPF
ncbi:MAG: single-stranded DNA-binding protein [Geitlerinemataceae cyanobacterium]